MEPTIEELRARLAEIETERRSIHTAAGDAALTDEQQTKWDALDVEETDKRSALKVAEDAKTETEARAKRVNESRAKWNSTQVQAPADTFGALQNPATMSRQALIDGNLRALQDVIEGTENQRHVEKLLKRHLNPTNPDLNWGANLLARSRPEYVSGWSKIMTGRDSMLTSEERAAIAVGTSTQGGALVPTFLDPTLILTNAGTANAIRPISRNATLTEGNTWHGVSTAGVTASFDGELVEVSDDSPTVAAPSVPLYTARAFVQASYEAFDDIANLADDVLMLFADARDRLEGAKHATGNGTTEPQGIFTVIGAASAQQIVSTTAAAIGLVDLQAVYKTLGRRWRSKSTWLMNPTYLLAIQALGTALSASYSTNLVDAPTDKMIGRPLVETDDAPTTQTTTLKDPEIILGDFSNFLVVDKPGSMSVEFVPQLFNTANNLPDGRRGWIAHWRNGSGSLNNAAFEMLVDKTSA